MIRHFFMHPPIWLEKILRHSKWYRTWFIREVCKDLRNDLIKSLDNYILNNT